MSRTPYKHSETSTMDTIARAKMLIEKQTQLVNKYPLHKRNHRREVFHSIPPLHKAHGKKQKNTAWE